MRNLVIFTMLLCLLCGTGFVAVADDANPDIAYDGLDISDYQKDIDWEAIARNKRIKYIYIKATEGVTYKSKRYRSYLEQARKHGIKVGSYHFMRTGSSVHDQFENFKSVVKKSEQDLLPLIDIEVHNGWTNQQIRDSVKVFADLIEKHYGCKPMIYTGAYFYNNILGRAFNDYPLFIARYANTPPVINGASWTLWQFSEKGRVDGISTPVDLSCFNKGCSLHSILIKDNHSRSHRGEATEKKEKADKEPKAAPKPSKHQEKEDKKKAEKERKAKERAEKLRKEEEEKQRKQAAEQEKKRKQAAEQEKAKREKEQRAAEEKAKREAEKRAAEERAKLEKEEREAAKRAAEAEKKALEAERRAAEAQKRAAEEEQRKAEEDLRRAEAEKAAAEAEKAAAEKKQKELEERAKKQQAQPSKNQQRRQDQRARQQQQRQNQRQQSQQQNNNNSNTERTNKSSADND